MTEIKNKNAKFKIYNINEIQKVYKQHAFRCGTVVYSTDGGYIWQSVGMDSGKWNISNWLFAFIGPNDLFTSSQKGGDGMWPE